MKTKPHILFVDDERIVTSYYTSALEHAGYQVTQKLTVVDAVEFLKAFSQTIDGVILDLMLPLGDTYTNIEDTDELRGGIQVYKYLHLKHPGIPVLLLTNARSESLLDDFNFDDSVQLANKFDYPPFELVDLVNRLVGKTHASDG